MMQLLRVKDATKVTQEGERILQIANEMHRSGWICLL